MYKRVWFLLLLLLSAGACRKTARDVAPAKNVNIIRFPLADVKNWLAGQQPLAGAEMQSFHQTLHYDLQKAEAAFQGGSNWWVVSLGGKPVFQGAKQGYRKLVFYWDQSGRVHFHALDIIPDALYIQRKLRAARKDFTGRVFVLGEEGKLLWGVVYGGGRVIGQIKPARAGGPQVNKVTIEQDCEWVDGNYVTDEGPVIYSELVCSTTVYDDGGDGIGGGLGPVTGADYLGGGGGGGGDASSAPPAANLPGEDDPKIDPKKYMDCFGTVPDAGAKCTVTVYVQEPWPGTSFNVGPNSVGHTAIGLTKVNGNTTVTQVVGFYPDATGFAKIHSPSKLLDNGFMEYTQSITYSVSPTQFQKIVNYISKPPVTYDITDFNCTNFVYNACKSGGVVLPDPTVIVGLSGPGGATMAMTPAGLGNKLNKMTNNASVNLNGGLASGSKGGCN